MIARSLVSKEDENKRTILRILNHSFNDSEVKRILSSADGSVQNILCFLAKGFTRSSKDFLKLLKEKFTKEELKEMALTRNKNGLGSLMCSVQITNEKDFQTMWSFIKEIISDEKIFKQTLLDVVDDYKSVLAFASLTSNVDNFKFVLNVYKSFFKVETMREIISKRRNQENIFQFAVDRWHRNHLNDGACEMLWKYMQEILDEETLEVLSPQHRDIDEKVFEKILFKKAYLENLK